jgi:N-acyl amino acid synthase of PEP-CTERM/exosortase system
VFEAPLGQGVSRYAEISRLAVSKVFRRRQGDTFYGGVPRLAPTADGDMRVEPFPQPQETPEIVSGIYQALYQESKRVGIEHWLVAMERGLELILRRMGFHFNPIGPRIDYFGPVRPYVASIQAVEQHLYHAKPDLLRFLLDGLERELWPALVPRGDASWGDVAAIA